MVLFHFPPLGGVPVPRNVRAVRYLPRYGWTPVVVTPRDPDEVVDPGSLALVPPGTTVLRTRILEPRQLRPVVALLRRLVGRLERSSVGPGDPAPSRPDGPSRFWRLQRLVFFPDSQVGWLPFAVAAAVREHRKARFDAVFSTSSPVTAHLIAGLFSSLTRVPWVAEFRDPWVGNPIAEPLPWFHRRLQARLERWIVRSADRTVFVGPSTTRLYRKRYRDAAEMVTITNGHDRSETPPHARSAWSGTYRIVWAGTLYRPGELEVFLEGLRRLVARRPELSATLEIDFYGSVSTECRAVADRFTRDSSLGAVVRFPGVVPRRAALEALADADAALVMLGDGPGMGQFVPGKLFEIIGQDRQVLAILPPGDARDILEGLGWGVIANPEPTAVERAIEHLLTLPPPVGPADPEGRYDGLALVHRLADTLQAATQRAKRADRAVPTPHAIEGAAR